MSRQRTRSRLTVLETWSTGGQHKAILAAVASRDDLTEAEIMQEAERVREDFQRLGLVTWEEQLAYTAADLGMTVAELNTELDTVVGTTR